MNRQWIIFIISNDDSLMHIDIMYDLLSEMMFQKNVLYPSSGCENNVLINAKMEVGIALLV
jgi:hypothetical protein